MTRRRTRDVQPEEASLFRETVGKVQPVPTRRVVQRPKAPSARARFRRADELLVLDESLRPAPAELTLGEELSYRQPQVPPQVLRDLRRGRYAIQDELDLHGLTATKAREALTAFMAGALARELRCIRIVHGKGLRSGPGGPVLKARLGRWLPQWDAVLAFTSAPPRDGGTGALYVLLRRRTR